MNRKIIRSGLNANSFGRTNLVKLIEKNGFFAEIESPKKIVFSEWKFEGTQVDENQDVWFCGDLFDNAIFFNELVEKNDKNAICAVVKVLSEAINQNIELGEIGAGGILVDSEYKKFVILPSEVFESCVMNDKKDYSILQGFYNYKGLKESDCTIFQRAVFVYKALTGRFPYSENDISKRQADIFDANFIPLSYSINGINKGFADSVDAALSLRQKFEVIPGESRYKNEKAERIRKDILDIALTFDFETFEKELFAEKRENELSESEFQLRTNKYLSSKKRKVLFNRFVRRNKSPIIAAGFVLLAFIWGYSSFRESNGRLPTSLGLDSTQTSQVFYTFVHRANVPGLQEIAKGRKMSDFIQIISGFFVSNKERESFNASDKTVLPEEWLFYKTTSNFWTYGITQLKIDGIPTVADRNFPIRSDKPKPLTHNDVKLLQKGDTEFHTAEYYFVHTDTSRINIDKIVETLTLEWNGKRWIVKEINSNEDKIRTKTVKIKTFMEEYQKLLDDTAEDYKTVFDVLREKYDWLPTNADFENGARTLWEKYQSTAAQKYLD